MNVLSLFDGISCAHLALDRAGINVNNYYASEIDKYAIQVTMKNYPNTIQLGDVRNIDCSKLPKIDLLIGGSPCQDLSIAKANRKGLDGDRSGLFYEYVRILKELKPKYFILENVASMPKEAKETITKELYGIEPIMINAALVSAQNRKRLFWTNIEGVKHPEDKGILLKDVLDDLPFRELKPFCFLTSSYGKSGMKCVTDDKFHNLTTSNTHNRMYLLNSDKAMMRTLTANEYERLQCVPDNYTDGISTTQRYKCLGNAFNVDVVAHILRYIKE